MEIIQGTTDFRVQQETAVTIGKFDGIHIGHQKLLDVLLQCKRENLKTVVFTFQPSPVAFFGKGDEKELTTTEEKRKLFAEIGVDLLIEYPLTKKTAETEPEEFIREVLFDRLRMNTLVAGPDLSFGRKGAGNLELIEKMADILHYETCVVEKERVNGDEVSSTRVREEVSRGNMPLVSKLLGNPYRIHGIVQHGQHLGTRIGMPTVNQIPVGNKLLPPFGVYFSTVMVDGRILPGITNIGIKPTVTDQKVPGVETYLYDFDGDLYGKEIEVSLLFFHRPEQRFSNVEALKTQLINDMENGKKYHKIV